MSYRSPNSQHPFDQLPYLISDLDRSVNKKWWRWFTIWFSGVTYTIISYRLDRLGFLIFKRSWAFLRYAFFPFFILFHLLGAHHDIHYTADIGSGLLILHGSLGTVVTRNAVIGKRLLLTGGNCIGIRRPFNFGDLVLGDDVALGANAVILGPVKIGSHVQIGAGAVVVDDAPDNVVLAGVPAKIIKEIQSS